MAWYDDAWDTVTGWFDSGSSTPSGTWDWVTDSQGNTTWANIGGTLPAEQKFDYSNYWGTDDQTSGSVTSADIKSFLGDYPEYTSFFTDSTISSILGSLGAGAKNLITNKSTGQIDPSKIASLAGGILGGINPSWMQPEIKKTGYQGGIPSYSAVREQVPGTYDPNRRPGSRGQEYFTDVQYTSPTDVATAQATAAQQAQEAEARNKAREAETREAPQVSEYAAGGLANLAKGRYLGGPTDGMADKLPATIENKQPAKLSHGEFVISADCVSALGGGNSEAGAQRLYDMMDRIRMQAHGKKSQMKPVNPKKVLPA